MRFLLLALLFALATAKLAPLLHIDSPNVIPGSYIIVLKDGLEVTDRDAHVIELRESVSDENKVVHLYNIGKLMGFSAKLNNDTLHQQMAHPNVKYIEADQTVSGNYIKEKRAPFDTSTETAPSWGIDRIDQRNLPLDGSYIYNTLAGNGVDVYVLDTGIQTSHPDFQGRATSVFNAIEGESGQDWNGHGTFNAGIIGGTIYGVAKQVQLKSVKVLNATQAGAFSGIIAGVNYVTNNKSPTRKSVAFTSFGAYSSSTTIDEAVRNSISSGVPYVIAAGNNNAAACTSSPARVSTAITVGATTNTDARSSFSNYGSCVTLFAPGSSIISDFIGNNATMIASGTAAAASHVTGVIALQIAQGNYTPAQIKSWLTTHGTPRKVTSPGTGSHNILLFSNPE